MRGMFDYKWGDKEKGFEDTWNKCNHLSKLPKDNAKEWYNKGWNNGSKKEWDVLS